MIDVVIRKLQALGYAFRVSGEDIQLWKRFGPHLRGLSAYSLDQAETVEGAVEEGRRLAEQIGNASGSGVATPET